MIGELDPRRCKYCDGTGRRPNWFLLGYFMRKEREAAKISLRGMARELDMSAPHLSDLEKGRRPWGGANARKYLGVFGIDKETINNLVYYL